MEAPLFVACPERGVPIVGCEPSCLLTLRDEYPDLVKDDRSPRNVGPQVAILIDEFLSKLAGSEGDLGLDLHRGEQETCCSTATAIRRPWSGPDSLRHRYCAFHRVTS